jgi:hypothetical protein
MNLSNFDWQTYLLIVASIMGFSLLGFFLLIGFVVRRMRQIDVPPDADFNQTLLLTPFIAVLAIDLLDLGLDMLAAPIVWILLDRLGLKALRNVAAVEALLPFTQPIPTLTVCWLAVRWGFRF